MNRNHVGFGCLMPIQPTITRDAFVLGGVDLKRAEPPDVFHRILGPPTRIIEAGGPAPAGHRATQIHIYDAMGLYLNEHHFTFTVEAVTFVLWREESHFPPLNNLSIPLDVGGVAVVPGIAQSALLKSTIGFERAFRGRWFAHTGSLSIGFDAVGRQTGPRGRRSSRREVVSVCVGLENDPRDVSHRPESLIP